MSPDGKHVYAASGTNAAVAVFSRNATTGALSFVEELLDGGIDAASNTVDGLFGAVSVSVSPDSKHVYVAGGQDNAVAVFSRNATTGVLTFVEVLKDGLVDAASNTVDGLAGVRWVEVSRDGKHVYTAASTDNAIAVFSRNATTGVLTFVEVLKDGGIDAASNTVDGLLASRGVTVSPDGKHVYATGSSEHKVSVFSRNATTGVLTFVEIQTDGVNFVDGLQVALVVTVSPDGKHLYVTGNGEAAVAVFSRNATTGALTFVEVLKDGGLDAASNTLDGLNGAFAVKVSPDGSTVYVGGSGGDEMGVFSRNATSGILTFSEVHKDDGIGGSIDGLDGPSSLSVSPDGKHLYVAGQSDDSIVVFSGTATVVGALSSTSVVPATLMAGSTFTVDVTFTTVNAVNFGKIQVTFPAGFDVSSAGVNASGTNIAGSLAIDSVSGQIVTITNATISAGQAGAAFTLTLIKNPTVTGGTGVFGIETQTVGGFPIDEDTSVAQVTITAGALMTTSVVPASLVTGTTGNVVVTFTTRNEVASGKVQITFPAGFDVSGAGVNASGTNITGSLALDGVAGQIVTINSATIAQSQIGAAFTLTGIKNPTATGGTGVFGIETQTGGSVKIDEDTSVAQVTITEPAPTPTPIPGVGATGLIVLAILMVGAAFVMQRRRPMQQA